MPRKLNLKHRPGSRPKTTNQLPHSQLDQHGPDSVIDKLHDWAFSLSGVENRSSRISVPGARALVMHASIECNQDAFMIDREFAHIHPHPDSGSMHVMLDPEDASEVADKGWGEDHYLVTAGRLPKGLVMVFSPRDDVELDTIKQIVRRSYNYAVERRD
ncbi:MAG: hypothetical protein AAGA23_03435 [Pseudomonadota bacterium]